MSEIYKVADFHKKFGCPLYDGDQLFPSEFQEAREFRSKFLKEELEEFDNALDVGDRVKAFDALIDLVYVALGTALWMGLTPKQWDQGFAVVHAANMTKIRAPTDADSKRGTSLDVIKPKDWASPERALEYILTKDDVIPYLGVIENGDNS